MRVKKRSEGVMSVSSRVIFDLGALGVTIVDLLWLMCDLISNMHMYHWIIGLGLLVGTLCMAFSYYLLHMTEVAKEKRRLYALHQHSPHVPTHCDVNTHKLPKKVDYTINYED